MDESSLIHSVSIAEFDIKIGVTLSHIYPTLALEKFEKSEVASLCLPDGGHKVAEDWTYMIFKEANGASNSNQSYIYGLSYFRNVPDPSKPRGAVQMSMLLLLRKPYFLLFKDMVREALHRFMDDHDATAVKVVYETLLDGLNKSVQFTMFDRHFILNIPSLDVDPFPGSSVSALVKIFKQDVMFLWYAVLLGYRILVVGSGGEDSGNACMAIPNLVLPLKGFDSIITPYVQLTDMQALEKPVYIAGSSNPIMIDMKHMYDMAADISKAIVLQDKGLKLTSTDKSLVKKVLKGINNDQRGEKWVRRQFYVHTRHFLQQVASGGALQLVGANQSLFRTFTSQAAYVRHVEAEAAAASVENLPLATFQRIQEAQEDESMQMTSVQLMKLYFELDTVLEDLDDINQICDQGGVGVVAQGLTHDSSQIRKYAIKIISKLSTSVTGQVEIITLRSTLQAIVGMLNDKASSVVAAAVFCLESLSNLYIGVKALSNEDTVTVLCQLLCSESLVDTGNVRYALGATVLRVYRAFPATSRVPMNIATLVRDNKDDENFVDLMIELVDVWHERIPFDPSVLSNNVHGSGAHREYSSSFSGTRMSPQYVGIYGGGDDDSESVYVEPNPQLLRCLSALRSFQPASTENIAVATSALQTLNSLVSEKAASAIQAANLGFVGVIDNGGFLDQSFNCARTWETLAFLAVTRVGMDELANSRLLDYAIYDLSVCEEPSMHTLFIACFLESIAQQRPLAQQLLQMGGVNCIVDFVVSHYYPTRLDDDDDPVAPSIHLDKPSTISLDAPWPESTMKDSGEIPFPTAHRVRMAEMTIEQQRQHQRDCDFVFMCLPLLRCLQYVYREFESGSRERVAMRERLSALATVLDVDVDVSDHDSTDFQIILMSLLVTVRALEPSYYDWMVRTAHLHRNGKRRHGERRRVDSVSHIPIFVKGIHKPASVGMDSGMILKKGYLERQGKWNKRWARRWYVLTRQGDFIKYPSERNNITPSIIVNLSVCKVSVNAKKSTQLDIVTPRERVNLRASTPEECLEWVDAVKSVRTQQLEDNKSTTPQGGFLSRLKNLMSHEELHKLSQDEEANQQQSETGVPSSSNIDNEVTSAFPEEVRRSAVLRRVGFSKSFGRAAAASSRMSSTVVPDKPEAPSLDFRLVNAKKSEKLLSVDVQKAGSVSVSHTSSLVKRMNTPSQHQQRQHHTRVESWAFPFNRL